MHNPILLDENFTEVLDLLEGTKSHLFITGRAGTGKSTLLDVFRKTTSKRVVVVAPTGVAALNVKGQTIHSFFGFAPRLINAADIQKSKRPSIFKAMEVLIIDEVSMVRAEVLDHIDYALRLNRGINDLFGGVQIVLIGDLFQLPPVVATSYEKRYFQTVYESPYFFSAKVFDRGFELETIEMRKVYRQEEKRFVDILDSIRSGDIDADILDELNARHQNQSVVGPSYITLSARNHVAASINQRELNTLPGIPHRYQATISGQFNPHFYPTETILSLKEGAQVMFVRNDQKRRFVNGTIAKIKSLQKDQIVVSIPRNDQLIDVEVDRYEWEILKYRSDGKDGITAETVGSFQQYPLRLAWAITIHKSQGKTFDRVQIDLGAGAFEHGQAYVALSRCRTLDGIQLIHPIRYQDILVDERIADFYQRMKRW